MLKLKIRPLAFPQFDLVTFFLTRHESCSNLTYIIKTNILIKFQHAQVENVASRVLTRCSFNRIFDLKWPSFEFVQDLMQMNVLMQNVACRVLTRENVDDARQSYLSLQGF